MRLIEQFKEAFQNRRMAQYVGLKIAGLVVLIGVLIFILVLIFGEMAVAADISEIVDGIIPATHELSM